MVPCLHCGYLYLWLISSKHIYFQNLNYFKKQQEPGEAQTKRMASKHSTVKACSNFLKDKNDSVSLNINKTFLWGGSACIKSPKKDMAGTFCYLHFSK